MIGGKTFEEKVVLFDKDVLAKIKSGEIKLPNEDLRKRDDVDNHLLTALEMGFITPDEVAIAHKKKLTKLELYHNNIFCKRSMGKAENYRRHVVVLQKVREWC